MSADATKTQVFVSSVFRDFESYRQSVLDAIWRCDMYPIGMERLDIALPISPSESSRQMTDDAQIYLGVFSQRYGVITEQEYRWAVARGIPILAFISDVQLDAQDVEPDPDKAARMIALKKEIQEKYVYASFHSLTELHDKVFASLVEWQRNQQRAAPERSPISQPRRMLVADIPRPPTPYYAHPYFLGKRFFGREAELGQIDAWAQAREPMLIIDAIGGAGKSALTWYWMRERAGKVLPALEGVLWWSFYESDATMGNLLVKLLAYLTERPVGEFTGQPRYELEQKIFTLLDQRHVLLVFDGIERILRAYHRMDAPQLADEAAAASQGQTPSACIDPRDGAFLRRLTMCRNTKILISSRLVPQDVQDRMSQQLLPGVRNVPLYGMTPHDALAMFEGLGVHGTRELMRTFLDKFGDHALLIGVIAGRIRAYRPAPGNFDAWYAAVGKDLQLQSTDLTQQRASILAAALDDLSPDLFHFLGQIAAFRYPVEYAALVAINLFAPPADPEPTEEQTQAGLQRLDAALSELEERGLVQWDRETNRYDLHPVVRAYAYDRLTDRAATYDRIHNYFERQPEEDLDTVNDVSDLRRTLEMYHALVGSSQFDAAFTLYRDRLEFPLRVTIGTYHVIVETLMPYFPKGVESPPTLDNPMEQGHIINSLALALNELGDHNLALVLFAQTIYIAASENYAKNLSTALQNFGDAAGDAAREIRELAIATQITELALELAQSASEQEEVDILQQYLIQDYALISDFPKAENAYQTLLTSPDDEYKNTPFTAIYAAQLRFFQGNDPTADITEALQQTDRARFTYAQREARRLQGEIALAQGDLLLAETAWLGALEIAQKEGIPLWKIQADLARLRAQQGDTSVARELIAEALAEGEPHLEAAEVYLALGDLDLARQHIIPAYKRAWADGPPYSYFYGMKRARAVLAALGMAEPQLPPYDPARVRPIPYEKEIRAFIEELRAKKAQGESDADDGEDASVVDSALAGETTPATETPADIVPPEMPAQSAPVPVEQTPPQKKNGWWPFGRK